MGAKPPPSEAAAEPTIEEALAELREMSGHPVIIISFTDFEDSRNVRIVSVMIGRFEAPTLSEALQKVRDWKANQ